MAKVESEKKVVEDELCSLRENQDDLCFELRNRPEKYELCKGVEREV